MAKSIFNPKEKLTQKTYTVEKRQAEVIAMISADTGLSQNKVVRTLLSSAIVEYKGESEDNGKENA